MSEAPLRHHSVQVPATSANLGAGFDAFGLAVDRHLAVRSVRRDVQDERVRTLGTGEAELATGDDNLIWRAFEACCAYAEVPAPDVGLVARSSIPLERGLGSSSSAIVAGVVLARALTGVALTATELVGIASDLEGHPDNVAPALLGGLVACLTGDDGRVIVRRINPAPNVVPVLFIPDDRQATSSARAVLPDCLDRGAVADQAARAGHVLAALTGAWPLDARASGDRLHEPSRLEVMAPTAALLGELRAAGVHAWLSGAGPSAVAIVDARTAADGDQLTAVGRAHGFEVECSRFELSGARTCPDDGCGLGGGGCLQCPRERL